MLPNLILTGVYLECFKYLSLAGGKAKLFEEQIASMRENFFCYAIDTTKEVFSQINDASYNI